MIFCKIFEIPLVVIEVESPAEVAIDEKGEAFGGTVA